MTLGYSSRPNIKEGPIRLDWLDRAICVGANIDVFFPIRGRNATAAKAICAVCPVRDECLEEFLHEPFGVFGGMSEGERERLRGARNRERRSA